MRDVVNTSLDRPRVSIVEILAERRQRSVAEARHELPVFAPAPAVEDLPGRPDLRHEVGVGRRHPETVGGQGDVVDAAEPRVGELRQKTPVLVEDEQPVAGGNDEPVSRGRDPTRAAHAPARVRIVRPVLALRDGRA